MKTVQDFVHKGHYPYKTEYSKSHCAFSVHEQGRGVGFYQCNKGIKEIVEGVGFCAVHAKEVKRQLGISVETKIKFAAKLNGGEPIILKLEVSNETDKTIDVESVESVMGNGFGFMAGRQRKDNPYSSGFTIFDDKNKAIEFLIGMAEKHIHSCEYALAKAEEVHKKLLESWYK